MSTLGQSADQTAHPLGPRCGGGPVHSPVVPPRNRSGPHCGGAAFSLPARRLRRYAARRAAVSSALDRRLESSGSKSARSRFAVTSVELREADGVSPAAGSFRVRRDPCCAVDPAFNSRAPSAGTRPALVRQVPGLQRVRDARRGGRRQGRRREGAAEAAPPARRRRGRGGEADLDRRARARPRARRRPRAGVARARRRRARRRQVDAAPDGAPGDEPRPPHAPDHGRGVGRPGEAARRAARRRGERRDPRRDRARRRLRDARARSGPTSA